MHEAYAGHQQKGMTMKPIYSFLGALTLLLCLLTTARAQSDATAKQQPLMDGEAPWGMMIVFAEGTTITQANALRLEHGLILAPMGYQASDGSSYNYGYADDTEYLRFARAYYGTACDPCAPITPVSAYYEPVAAEVEAALLADPRVAALDNRNEPTFFFVTMIKAFIDLFWDLWQSDRIGPVG